MTSQHNIIEQTKNDRSVLAVFKTFLQLGLTSFGGPIAHIGYFRKELVEKQSWVSDNQFSQLLAICQFLPGPASSQLGFSLGLLRAGWLGALAAFLAFTLPSAIALIGFATLLPYLSSNIGEASMHGLKLVAFAVVADAVWAMSKKLCSDVATRCIALVTTIILLTTNLVWAQLLVVLGGAIAGIFLCSTSTPESKISIKVPYGKTFALILLAIFLSLLSAAILIPHGAVLQTVAQTFYRVGALVFGGGHVVLPLLQDATVTPGLISNESFLSGYGASQAIPGPMFSFSAYLGAIMPAAGAVSWLGASIALACIFLPGFLLVSAVLPLWQSISGNPVATKAIAGINAAVVGLLLAALYNPIIKTSIMNFTDLAISLIGLAMLMVWRLSPLLVVLWCLLASISLVLL